MKRLLILSVFALAFVVLTFSSASYGQDAIPSPSPQPTEKCPSRDTIPVSYLPGAGDQAGEPDNYVPAPKFRAKTEIGRCGFDKKRTIELRGKFDYAGIGGMDKWSPDQYEVRIEFYDPSDNEIIGEPTLLRKGDKVEWRPGTSAFAFLSYTGGGKFTLNGPRIKGLKGSTLRLEIY